MKKVLITQSNYIPWKGYFDSIHSVDLLILYDDVQFTKRDWRSRNRIKTPRGTEWLTVPVEVKGKFHQAIRDTKVADPGWGQSHWDSLRQNYSKAPHFKRLAERLEPIYRNPPSEYLSEINKVLIQFVMEELGIRTEIKWSHDFKLAEGRTERLVDLCKQVGATDYYSGPAAKAYMEADLFEKAGVRLHYFDYSGYPEYPQLWGDFVHEVTVLDLLFNQGPDATRYLKTFGSKT